LNFGILIKLQNEKAKTVSGPKREFIKQRSQYRDERMINERAEVGGMKIGREN
jgi:hypothetical protein